VSNLFHCVHDDAVSLELSSLLESWHPTNKFAGDGPDTLICGTGAVINASLVVRGCGLVASAFGVLQCPSAVEALVACWTAGPWAGRLTPGWDYALCFHAWPSTAVQQVAQSRDANHQARTRVRLGRMPPRPWLRVAATEDGLLKLEAELRKVKPHVRGGGCATLCTTGLHLPVEACVSDSAAFLTGVTDPSAVQIAASVEAVKGVLQGLGPPTAASVSGGCFDGSGKNMRRLHQVFTTFEIELA
jgi:hypothetical protein